MKIGVISDTHLTTVDDRFARLAHDRFSDVDAIIHAGDIVEGSVLDFFSSWHVLAVRGNMDRGGLTETLPIKRIEELGGKRIGIIHGSGIPDGLVERVREQFEGDRVDCIVFGHSHAAHLSTGRGLLMLNPGSPTDRRFAEKNTLGYLIIENDTIIGEIQEI